MTADETKAAKKSAKASGGFSAEEKAAMRQRAKEQKAEAEHAEGEADALASIAAMQPSDRAMAERLHAIIKDSAPTLAAKTWYGMPAYARDGKIICFFQPAAKFKTRYATFGFSDKANLDEGEMWPNSYALRKLTPVEEKKILELVKRAIS